LENKDSIAGAAFSPDYSKANPDAGQVRDVGAWNDNGEWGAASDFYSVSHLLKSPSKPLGLKPAIKE
jgi:hypothetical protein